MRITVTSYERCGISSNHPSPVCVTAELNQPQENIKSQHHQLFARRIARILRTKSSNAEIVTMLWRHNGYNMTYVAQQQTER